jgi:hypothetical protein
MGHMLSKMWVKETYILKCFVILNPMRNKKHSNYWKETFGCWKGKI